MNHKPLISIIIPLYNGSNYVEEAIQSALNQTYEHIEIIVVNDGSTDNGAGKAICERYAERIVYFEKENGGCASALNYGIRNARGELISWLSHDDLYEPRKLEKQVALYHRHQLDMGNTVISSVGKLIDADGKPIPHPSRRDTGLYPAEKAFAYFLFRSCPNGCGLLIPKRCFEDIGWFDESLRYILDWNLWLKFALSGVDFYLDSEKLVSNRVHSMQVSARQRELHEKETCQTVEQLFEWMRSCNAKGEYLRMLYDFSYSSGRGDAKAIRQYLQSTGIGINSANAFRLRMKLRLKRFAKYVYHKIR